jgi:hypothetical protein
VSFDPATTGDVHPPAATSPAPAGSSSTGERRLGFAAEELASVVSLPYDGTEMARGITAANLPFFGAFVPVVIHDPLLAERSYDAAEWAADLIREAGGRSLALAPYVESGWAAASPLSPRHWNHAVAMVERLSELCRRVGLGPVVSETIEGRQTRPDGGLDPGRPIHYLLDAGNFVPDGFIPARLLSPQPAGGRADHR